VGFGVRVGLGVLVGFGVFVGLWLLVGFGFLWRFRVPGASDSAVVGATLDALCARLACACIES